MKAYPQKYPIDASEPHHWIDNPLDRGMDLRDYFAGKSLPLAFKVWENFYSSEENDDTYKTSNFQADKHYQELIANTAYQFADAMMKARGNV